MEMKRVSDSLTKHVEILMPAHLNGYGRLFGGELMRMIDVVAAVAARRHSNREVTTACIDSLVFEGPAAVNDTIELEARLTYVGRTSMEVRVDTVIESLNGSRVRVNRAYLVMVALDPETHTPTQIPGLIYETDEEKAEAAAAEERRMLRKRKGN